MTAPAWKGPKVVAVCPEGHKMNVPDRGQKTRTGHCRRCERQRELTTLFDSNVTVIQS